MNQPRLKEKRAAWWKNLLRIGFAFVVLNCVVETARAQAIFGSVRTVGGVPIEGVLVRATRTLPTFQQFTTTTDSSGGYVVGSGLSGTYSVQAIESGYTFTPASTNVTISGSSIRVDFTTPATAPNASTLTAINVTETSAQMRGSVRANGASTAVRFELGLTTNYGNTYPAGSASGTNFGLFAITAPNLLNNRTYHFRATASNSFGLVFGADETFTTLQGFPSVITLGATQITATAARLNGSVNPTGSTARAWFEFGITTNYGTVTAGQNVGSGNTFSNFNQLVGLTPGTTYHYRAVGSNIFGVRFGADTNFTTLSGIPSVITFPPSQLGATTARLNGSVNPNGANATAWFDLGTTTNYGDIAVGQNLGGGTVFTNYNQMLIGLTPGTTYHYRAAAASSFGTNYGTNIYFTPLFTDSGATNVPSAPYGGLAWGDYDNDGRLDVVGGFFIHVWRNTGGGFVANTNAGLPYAADGFVAWGDYDSDGWLDILLTGWTFDDPTTGMARVYRNNRDGTFSDIHAGLPKIHRSSAVWGDYNNDGRPDILLAGLDVNRSPIAQVWRQIANGFVLDTNAVLPGVAHGGLAWGDYDNDGRLDILLAGSTTGRNPYELPHASIAQVWRNTGNGFVNINASLPGISGWNNHSAVAWGDYDNDGRLDIVLAGTTNGFPTGAVCQVWHNTGSGFALNASLTGVFDCAVAWGDYDNDGRLDILLSGSNADFDPTTEVWRNTGTGFFNINAGLIGNRDGGAAWGDYDNDGRLDIIVTGLSSAGDKVWRNNFPMTNSPPSAPSGLTFTLANSAMTLAWNAATDNETPAAGLSYNIRIGTTPGGSDVFSAMAGGDGFRRVPQLGNALHRLSTTLNLPSMSTPYHWSVQAVDGAFAGSVFAAENTFKLLPVLVPVTATNTVPGDLNGDGMVDQTELNIALSNYWPHSPWIEMTNTSGLGTTNVQFALTNTTGWNFSVEVSTNLMNWDFLGPAFPFYQFADPAATNEPQRYYRLRWP